MKSTAPTLIHGDPYPHSEVYEDMYAKYLQGDRTEEMIELAGDLEGKLVLDICGGGGRLSMMARKMGAQRVWYVDQSENMAARLMAMNLPFLHIEISPVMEFLKSINRFFFADVVFCQQAVNYWMDEKSAHALARIMKPGTTFIFNTFNKCPGPFPKPKIYKILGVEFMELSWSIQIGRRTMIEHTQIREGMPPHRTCFYWISPEDYTNWLSPWFDIEERRDGPSSIYQCVRNENAD